MNGDDRYNEWLRGVCRLIYERRVMSQAELSRRTGATREHINAVLRGRTDAGNVLQSQICQALGWTYDQVRDLGRQNDPLAIQAAPANDGHAGQFSAVMTAFAVQVAEWWRTIKGDDLRDAIAFSTEFERRFPEFLAWRQSVLPSLQAETGERHA